MQLKGDTEKSRNNSRRQETIRYEEGTQFIWTQLEIKLRERTVLSRKRKHLLLWLLRRLQSPISRNSDGLPPARNAHSSVRLSLIARRRVGIEGRRQAEGKGLWGGELFLVDGDKKMEGLSGQAPYCKRGTVVGPRHEAGMRRFSLQYY
jgi:hypothetical protein